MRVFARMFVMELMAGSGGTGTGSIIPAERRRGKKLWFRVRRGSARGSISSEDGKDEGHLVYWGLCRGYWNICFLPHARGKTSTKVIDCLIIPKNMRMALLSAFRVAVQIIVREEDAREKVNCDKFIP